MFYKLKKESYFQSPTQHQSVIIVGGGPTGLVLANLLGQLGVQTLVIEQQSEVYNIPRATHIDEETLRNFQLTGLIDEFLLHTSLFGFVEVQDEKGNILFADKVQEEEILHGYSGSRFFDQPAFERILWQGLTRFECVEILKGYEATHIHQENKRVEVSIVSTSTQETFSLTGDYLVACDGAKSKVRNLLSIEMTQLAPSRAWVIVDTLLNSETHISALPNHFQYILNPERLTIYAYGYGLNRRWEFQLATDELPDLSDKNIQTWLSPYVSLDKLTIIRIANYQHHSLVANTWRKERIFLAGDAAHLMPPTAGQGLCSGVRDAVNLAWKLAETIKNEGNIALLDTYEKERKSHLLKILERTLFYASRLKGDNYVQRFIRKIGLQIIQNITPLRNYLKYKYNQPTQFTQGYLQASHQLVGTHLPQFRMIFNTLSDEKIGYQWVILTTKAYRSQLSSRFDFNQYPFTNISIIEIEGTNFQTWFHQHQLAAVVVRPDKIIYQVVAG